jgi:hypothetical protein
MREPEVVSGTLVLLPPRRNAAFIPVDESQELAVAEIAKACGKTDHTRQQERCLGVTQADRADSQRGDDGNDIKARIGAYERRCVSPMIDMDISGQGKKNGVHPMAQQESSEIRAEEEQAAGAEESAPQPVCQGTGIPPCEMAFRPLTRIERRTLWLKEYGEQDMALQMWTRLVEQQDLEIEMLLQMHGLLVFGVMVSTLRYAQFYINLYEELHRENEPETADAMREYYMALLPPQDQPEIGPEGLPVVSHYVHMSDVTIMSAGHKMKLPFWRGKMSQVDAFVMGATASE